MSSHLHRQVQHQTAENFYYNQTFRIPKEVIHSTLTYTFRQLVTVDYIEFVELVLL